MRFMNNYDLYDAHCRFTQNSMPNRLALVMVVNQLRKWADNYSDGWAYWPKPVRAAAKAIELIEGRHDADITDAEMRAAVRPIKAFMTRQGVSPTDRELILRAVEQVAA